MRTLQDAIAFIFQSKHAHQRPSGALDEQVRDVSPTRRLLLQTRLLDPPREYAVVTGSKGKGSVTALTASILRALGHTVGMLTSPHMVHWTERIRVNGRAIPEADFVRIVRQLKPAVEDALAHLGAGSYFSPQGILLAVALQWFNEQGATCAVLEVGRGGRYDDVSLVPNKVSLFTPIFLEHAQYLGSSVERIAWHKAGIIKPLSYAYSVAQAPEVLATLEREANAKQAEFFWLSVLDKGELVRAEENGLVARIGRYGEVEIPFLGTYQIENTALAIQAAGNMHGRLSGIPHSAPEYVERVKLGVLTTRWYGRLQRLQTAPSVYVDGAINVQSATELLASLEGRITRPLVVIAGVPRDRDVRGVLAVLAPHADALLLTESSINPNIIFPPADEVLAVARSLHHDVAHFPALAPALDVARQRAAPDGTVLLVVAQPLVGEALLIYDVDTRDV